MGNATQDERVGGSDPVRLEDALRSKVQSKIDVAKVLGGVITLTLGWLVAADPEYRGDLRVELAMVALVFGLVLYVATLEAYDTLLMPQRYWKQSRRGLDAADVIHTGMLQIWRMLFLPATGAALVGLLLLVWAAFPEPGLAVALVGAVGAALVLYRYFRPHLLPGRRDRP
jgi:hypothetical protein